MSAALLLRAASCYQRSGALDDAGRCYEGAGRHAEAARAYEGRERWQEAARAYARAGDWRGAARCHLRAGQPEPAAECLLEAGDRLEAAWVLADGLLRCERARALGEALEPATEIEALGRELVLARCEAGKDRRSAALRLRQALLRIAALPATAERDRLIDRMLVVAASAERPDLEALVHAAAFKASVAGAAERWERWALARLGDASGVPGQGAVES